MSERQPAEHVPVLLDEAVDGLNVCAGGCYIDATLGRGGHSAEILRRLGTEGRLIGVDRDPEAVAAVREKLGGDARFEIVKGELTQLGEIARERGLLGNVNGLLFDLGVSSPQLDEADRGFSFAKDGPLDMRMDPDTGITAAEWLASAEEKDLRKVLYDLGEEKLAPRIARAIVKARAVAPITRTRQLADLVAAAVPARQQSRARHPATRTFQAIRMYVNRELAQLEDGLRASVDLLAPGGRLCVISFHSLEDRLVKRFMRDRSREPVQYRGLPDVPEQYRPAFRRVGGAIAPTEAEINRNPRARSARLRVAEKT